MCWDHRTYSQRFVCINKKVPSSAAAIRAKDNSDPRELSTNIKFNPRGFDYLTIYNNSCFHIIKVWDATLINHS